MYTVHSWGGAGCWHGVKYGFKTRPKGLKSLEYFEKAFRYTSKRFYKHISDAVELPLQNLDLSKGHEKALNDPGKAFE